MKDQIHQSPQQKVSFIDKFYSPFEFRKKKKIPFRNLNFFFFFNHWIYLMCTLLFYLDFLFSQNTQDFMNYGLDFRSQWVTNNVYISCIKNKSGLQVLV